MARHELVDATFMVRGPHRRPVAMIVEKVELGWCYCKSLDLQHVGRWPTDAVERALAEQGKAVPPEPD